MMERKEGKEASVTQKKGGEGAKRLASPPTFAVRKKKKERKKHNT